jgi:hypothetical protein
MRKHGAGRHFTHVLGGPSEAEVIREPHRPLSLGDGESAVQLNCQCEDESFECVKWLTCQCIAPVAFPPCFVCQERMESVIWVCPPQSPCKM